VEKRKQHEEDLVREEKLIFEARLRETRMKRQTELFSVKGNKRQDDESGGSKNMAKLPKLVISKYGSSYQDWPRFWGQFTESIDKTSIPPITKFTYLCELLDPKIKAVVDSLPFTSKGCNRAKSILKERFGKNQRLQSPTPRR
jgi:hypothetical protein